MITAILLVIFTSIFAFIYWCITQKLKYKNVNIPGPAPLPILGNALEFGQNPVDKLIGLSRTMDNYGPISRIWIGPNKYYLLVADPKMTEFFMSSPKYLTKLHDYDMFKPWLGNGLLVSTGSYWQKRRKTLTPTFHFKILDEFVPVFNSGGDILVQKLSQEIGNDVTDIYPYITAYTLDIICETAMGTTVNAQNDPNNEYVKCVKAMCNIIIERAFSPWKQFDALFKYSTDYKIQTAALKVIHGFTNSVIKARREELSSTSESELNKNNENDDLGIKKRVAFLDLLLKSTCDGKLLTDEDIREEVDTFMFEGHDTTASAISFAMYELAKNPHVQNKVANELKSIFGNNTKRHPTMQDINNMKYLELVVKETLRLYPSVPFFGRVLEEDVKYDGNVFPKGMGVLFLIYYMHKLPNIYKDPEQFNPDRFLTDKTDRNPFAYVPFSAGPRNCIGQKFAMTELKAVLCKVILNFVLKPVDAKYDVILSGETILKSANGISVKIEKRIF